MPGGNEEMVLEMEMSARPRRPQPGWKFQQLPGVGFKTANFSAPPPPPGVVLKMGSTKFAFAALSIPLRNPPPRPVK